MAGVKICYNSRDFLNKLALAVPNKNFSLEVTLRPDVDEIVKLSEMKSGFVLSSPIPEIQEDLELASLPLWDTHQVYPFWSLKVDYQYGNGEPELCYEGTRGENFGELTRKNLRPEVFISKRRWFGIHLINDNLGERIGSIKKSVYEFTGNGYRVSSLEIRKKPRFGKNYLGDDGSLFASRGKLEIFNEKNGNDLGALTKRILSEKK